MKIIRPIEILPEGIENNAPESEYIEWQPEGRDFMSGTSLANLTIAGDTAYFSEGEKIRKVNLVTGVIEVIPDGGWGGNVRSLNVSPDGAHIAVERESFSSSTVYFYRFSDSSIVAQITTLPARGRVVSWSSDSLSVATVARPSGFGSEVVRIYNAQNWQVLADSPNLASHIQSAFSIDEDISAFAGINYDEADANIFVVIAGYVGTTEREYLMRVGAPAGSIADSEFIYEGSSDRSRDSIYNQLRSEVLIFSPSVLETRSATNLDLVGLAPAIDGANRMSVSEGGSEIAVVRESYSPRLRRFNASDYTEILPDLSSIYSAASVADIKLSDSYYVLDHVFGGYALIARADDALITQTNPTVTEGDIYTYQNKNYEALSDNNDRPDLGALLEPPTWLNLGATNPLRMIDGQVGTFTEAAGPLEVVFSNVDIVDGIALFNLLAQTVLIELVDETEGVVFSTGEISLVDNTGVTDWYQYFYSPITNRQDFVFTGLPPYRGADVRVVLTDVSGVLQVGEIVLGPIRNLGDTEFGTSVGILDFSRKDRDAFGNFIITERRFSKRANYDISLRTNQIAFAQQLLAKLRATPAVFIGAESQPETIIYGFYRSFDIVLRGPVYSDCTIEVEGLT